MAKILFLIPFLLSTVFSVQAQDPTNKEECVDMLKLQLEKQCSILFGGDNKDLEIACLENVLIQTEKQCDRFFGGGNFCSVCTSECVKQYNEDDPVRIQCLQTCLNNPACVITNRSR